MPKSKRPLPFPEWRELIYGVFAPGPYSNTSIVIYYLLIINTHVEAAASPSQRP